MSPAPNIDRVPAPDLGRLLGRLLVLRREASGETVSEAAARAGISVPSLIEVEKGRANLTLKRIDRLAGLYGARLAIVDLDVLDRVAAWLDLLDLDTLEEVLAGKDIASNGVRYAIDIIHNPAPPPP